MNWLNRVFDSVWGSGWAWLLIPITVIVSFILLLLISITVYAAINTQPHDVKSSVIVGFETVVDKLDKMNDRLESIDEKLTDHGDE